MRNNLWDWEHLDPDRIIDRHENSRYIPMFYPTHWSDSQWKRHEVRNHRAKKRREKLLQDQRILDDLILSIQKATKTQELIDSIRAIVEKRLIEQETLKKKEKAI